VSAERAFDLTLLARAKQLTVSAIGSQYRGIKGRA
jgi:hypothetical protein